jgi:hypothetical protein
MIDLQFNGLGGFNRGSQDTHPPEGISAFFVGLD